MNNLTKEQMLELAKIVTGKEHGYRSDRPGVIVSVDDEIWSPSLTGDDWQVAQACRVIVAAFNLPRRIGITKAYDLGGVEAYIAETKDWGRVCPDLLTAASLALISGGRS